ncbi:MAG: hypothetical protein H0U52_07360 [Chloroflexi bacterium]|nr:hypothetical protein [Chloroflexota bacterium]
MNRIAIGPDVWPSTLDVFARFAATRMEGGCFWYGVRSVRPEEPSQVATVGIPKQVNRPRNFSIPADALADLNAAIRDDHEVLAQLHGHPSWDVAMSEWDEDLAVSRRIVSLVLPFWGSLDRLALEQIGIHVFGDGGWRRLGPVEASDLFVDRAGPPITLVDHR